MTKAASISMMLVLTAGLVLVGGCTKAVQVTFVNTTPVSLSKVQVTGPGWHLGNLGSVPADGQLRTKLVVHTGWLPYTYQWKADGYTGCFTVAGDSHDKIWVYIGGQPQNDPEARHAEGCSLTGGCARIVYYP